MRPGTGPAGVAAPMCPRAAPGLSREAPRAARTNGGWPGKGGTGGGRRAPGGSRGCAGSAARGMAPANLGMGPGGHRGAGSSRGRSRSRILSRAKGRGKNSTAALPGARSAARDFLSRAVPRGRRLRAPAAPGARAIPAAPRQGIAAPLPVHGEGWRGAAAGARAGQLRGSRATERAGNGIQTGEPCGRSWSEQLQLGEGSLQDEEKDAFKTRLVTAVRNTLPGTHEGFPVCSLSPRDAPERVKTNQRQVWGSHFCG